MAGGISTDEEENDRPVAWSSADGLHWTQVMAEMPPGRATARIDDIVSTGSGYLANGGAEGDAWLSSDAARWRHVAVMPRAAADLWAIGVTGDVVIGLEFEGTGIGRFFTWRGSLAAMGA